MTQKEKLVKFIKGMEKGYQLCPYTIGWSFYDGNPTNPKACCANGHAALGLTGDASNYHVSDHLIDTIVVQNKDGFGTMQLNYAIDSLVYYYKWITPEVIEWLRSQADQMD